VVGFEQTICSMHVRFHSYTSSPSKLKFGVFSLFSLIQLMENYKWIHFFFYRRLDIDGLSIGPILLTEFITTLATLAAQSVTREYWLFYFPMLAMYSGQIELFSSRDILIFFIMWELDSTLSKLKFIVLCIVWVVFWCCIVSEKPLTGVFWPIGCSIWIVLY
jgi:formate hydrogenlyase subunit 3/multisubunit Na+/H+ antiporter MnhD subunit